MKKTLFVISMTLITAAPAFAGTSAPRWVTALVNHINAPAELIRNNVRYYNAMVVDFRQTLARQDLTDHEKKMALIGQINFAHKCVDRQAPSIGKFFANRLHSYFNGMSQLAEKQDYVALQSKTDTVAAVLKEANKLF